MPKTIIIYDTCGEDQVRFIVVEGDKRNLDQVYVNESEGNEALVDELCAIVTEATDSRQKRMPVTFPYDQYIAGFIP